MASPMRRSASFQGRAAAMASMLEVPFAGGRGGNWRAVQDATDCRHPDSQRTSISSNASTLMPGFGASFSSVRSSLQSSIRSLGIFFIAPFSKHRCCLGCVSLRESIPLICVAELIMLSMAAVIVLDLYLADGGLFYTDVLRGKGTLVAQLFLLFVAASLTAIFLTLFAWSIGRPRLYLVHAVWQVGALSILMFMYSQVLYGMNSEKIIYASGCVICIFFTAVILLQLWWLFVIVDAAFFEGFYYRRHSSRVFDDEETVDGRSATSRKNNVNLPVVKVECVSE